MLLLIAAAHAALTCDDIQGMLAAKLPEPAIVATIGDQGVLRPDLPCTDALPPAIAEAARRHAVEPPPPAPAPEIPARPPTEPRPLPPTLTALPAPPAVRPGTDCPASVWVEMPDQGVAMGLSAIVGYGAGHFYARKPGVGLLFAVVETVGTGLLTVGAVELEPGVMNAGLGLLGAGRLIDLTTAPRSARQRGLEMLEAAGCR